jgi:uncharacterized membrane protein
MTVKDPDWDEHRVEKQELWDLIGQGPEVDRTEINEWVDETIDMHRAQAAAIEHREAQDKIAAFRSTWWGINWPVVLFFSIWLVGMLVIGLVNGWS